MPSHDFPVPVIGVIGGIGSGKSAVVRWVCDRFPTIALDADRAGHEVLEQPEIRQQVVEAFGPSILAANGNIDRKSLAQIVFGESEQHRSARLRLESIVHPEIRRLLTDRIRRVDPARHRAALLDAAILLESGWNEICVAVVFIDTPEEIRWHRLHHQRGWTREELASREASQWPLAKKQEVADHVVFNGGPLESSGGQLWEIVQNYLSDTGSRNHPNSM